MHYPMMSFGEYPTLRGLGCVTMGGSHGLMRSITFGIQGQGEESSNGRLATQADSRSSTLCKASSDLGYLLILHYLVP
jgi:hypothetical protein